MGLTFAEIAMKMFACCLMGIASCATSATAIGSERPRLAAYIHIDQCFDANDPIADREHDIAQSLDAITAAGFESIVPYVSTTSGHAHYPSELIPRHVWDPWDPIALFVDGARRRGLQVHLCVPVLNCGRDKPDGILKQHPEWALRSEQDTPLGAISPGHSEARNWIVRWLSELVDRYQPDGLLLDYLRFPSVPSAWETESRTRFQQSCAATQQQPDQKSEQTFRERTLTELVKMISDELRRRDPELHLAIYSWGHHVTSGHRVAQDWPTWAAEGYIDEVNVCGYWYPDTYPRKWGATHLEAFETVITDCQRQLNARNSGAHLTFALGVRTSHGRVTTVDDIASYLRVAAKLDVDGATFFTWSYLTPFLPQLEQSQLLKKYLTNAPMEDLFSMAQRRSSVDLADGSARSIVDHRPITTIRVNTQADRERSGNGVLFIR